MTEQRIKKFVGGQAVIEGVMMRGPKIMATACRKPDGTITVKEEPTKSIQDKYPILKLPFLRGTVALFESLVIGMKALSFSAQASGEEEEEVTNKEIAITMAVSVLIAAALFIVLPTWLAKFMPGAGSDHMILNLYEGTIRLVLFLLYIFAIGLTPDIKRVFQYHGAEHKTIHTYENDRPLTVEEVRNHSRLHARCGTNFLLFVMVVSIFVFAFLGWPNLVERIVSRLALMPVVAGISYELIRFAGRSQNPLMKAMIAPGLMLQYMTTREPDDDQIEVAIRALTSVRPSEEDAYEEE